MRFWIQYHNYDSLNYLPGGYIPDTTDIAALDTSEIEVSGTTTSKQAVLNTVGDTVFFVVGYGGRNKRYVLWSWCVVEFVESRDDEKFDAVGTGRVLFPLPELAGAEFETFKKQNANFSLGFRDISALPYVAELVRLASEKGRFELAETYARALSSIPEEVRPSEVLWQGAVRLITVNAYERNPEARRQCIEWYGTRCAVCGVDLESMYGPAARGITHVHHLRPLSETGKEYVVDPIRDLRPVCPNCHAVIHARRTSPYSIEEVKTFLEQAKNPL